MAAFSWMVEKIDVLQVQHRRSCRYGEQRTIFIPVRRRPTTSLRPATPARHACHAVQFVYYTSPARVIAACVCNTYVITTNIPMLITLQLIYVQHCCNVVHAKVSATCCTLLAASCMVGFTASKFGSIGKNGTSNFTNVSEWAWHVESRAWYAEVTGYTVTTVHVHFGSLMAFSNFTNAGRVSTKYKATLSPSLLALS